MISRSTNIRSALRARQRGFFLNPYRFGRNGGDPHFDKVSLLLHGDSPAIVDSSATPKSITAVGVAGHSAAKSKFGGGSLIFQSGNNSYISTTSNLLDFQFGTGDFVVEVWANWKFWSGEHVLLDFYTRNGSSASWQLNAAAYEVLWYRSGAGYDAGYLVRANVPYFDDWLFITVARSSGVLRLFFNGLLVAEAPDLSDYSQPTSAFGIGGQVASRSSAYDFTGYLDDVRITKGTNRGYTASFMPPTSAFPDF